MNISWRQLGLIVFVFAACSPATSGGEQSTDSAAPSYVIAEMIGDPLLVTSMSVSIGPNEVVVDVHSAAQLPIDSSPITSIACATATDSLSQQAVFVHTNELRSMRFGLRYEDSRDIECTFEGGSDAHSISIALDPIVATEPVERFCVNPWSVQGKPALARCEMLSDELVTTTTNHSANVSLEIF